jgi:hypothetical protein
MNYRCRVPLLVAMTFLLTMALPNAAVPTSQIPASLERIVKKAKLAFAGTVESVSYRRAEHNIIVTHVVLSRVQFAKGKADRDSVALTLSGGRLDGHGGGPIGQPRFEVGGRYILLTADFGSASNWYMPIVGLNQGFFRVKRSTGSTEEIYDWDGRALVKLAGGHLVLVGTSSLGAGTGPTTTVRGRGVRDDIAYEIIAPSLDPGSRLSEKDLLQIIATLDRG